jgi:hypothetical protein
MKASLIAYDFRGLYKKSELKIVNMAMSEAIASDPNLVAQNFRI